MMEAKNVTICGRECAKVDLGGATVWERAKLPEGLLLWYDVAKQRCTDESLAADPRLKDYSGNRNDLILPVRNGINWSGRVRDGGLYFDYYIDRAHTEKPLKLDDFTVIAKIISESNGYNDSWYFHKNNGVTDILLLHPRTSANKSDGNRWWSFGGAGNTNRQVVGEDGVIVMTPTSVNGVAIRRGTAEDTESVVYVCSHRTSYGIHTLYTFMLFGRTLTQEEIDYVLTNYIRR